MEDDDDESQDRWLRVHHGYSTDCAELGKAPLVARRGGFELVVHEILGHVASAEVPPQRNATQRNAAQRSATQRNAAQRNATQRSVTQRNATQRNATQQTLLPFHRLVAPPAQRNTT
jgi:hypothetical protein